MREVQLYVDDRGRLQFVHDDDVADALAGHGRSSTARASYVEPVPDARDGPPGVRWEIRPVDCDDRKINIGPFASRAEALTAERFWLEVRMTYGVVMVSFYQLGKVVELVERGWKVAGYVGPEDVVGSPTVMTDETGALQTVDAEGVVAPLVDGTEWVDCRSRQGEGV